MIYSVASLWIIYLWLFGFFSLYQNAGKVWALVGVVASMFSSGLGLFAIFGIAAGLHGQWAPVGLIIGGAIICRMVSNAGKRFMGLRPSADARDWVMMEPDQPDERHQAARDLFADDALLTEAAQITNAFGKFLAERQPIIWDAQLLPYPKSVIAQALVTYEQHLCDLANYFVETDQSDKLQEIKKALGPVGAMRVGLSGYADIDPEDVELVSYFNSFRARKDVPEDESARCLELYVKYMSRGTEESKLAEAKESLALKPLGEMKGEGQVRFFSSPLGS
jgi:hypothetical protein